MSDDNTLNGVVAFFNKSGGYGFIGSESLVEDAFFHLDELEVDTLSTGDKVRFSHKDGDKGPRVTSLEVYDWEAEEDAQDDETTDDTTNTMSNNNESNDEQSAENNTYGFVNAEKNKAVTVEAVSEDARSVRYWTLGDHDVSHGISADELQEEIDHIDGVNPDLKAVLEQAKDMVEGKKASNFECPVCGLNHGHSDDKHDIRAFFNVEGEFADEMKFCPFCHCGVNELAMLMDFYGVIEADVFTDGDEFGVVNSLSNDEIRSLYRAQNEVDEFGTPVGSILKEAGLKGDIPKDSYDEVSKFLGRVDEVKKAAGGAPIAGETRDRINELRSDLEAMLNE